MRIDSPEFDIIASNLISEIANQPWNNRYMCPFCGQTFFDKCPLRCVKNIEPGCPVVCRNKDHSHYGYWVCDYQDSNGSNGACVYVANKKDCLPKFD